MVTELHEDEANIYLQDRVPTQRLVVLVHGLNCSDAESYWGNIPELIIEQVRPAYDVVVWKYKSDLRFFDRIISLIKRDERLASARTLGRSLNGYLLRFAKRFDQRTYDKIVFIGHSQGGLVAINGAFERLVSHHLPAVTGVCAASTPTKRALLATAHSILAVGSNPQTRYLGRKKELDDDLGVRLPAIKLRAKTHYIEAVGDEVLDGEQPSHFFDTNESISGGHAWPAKIQNSTQGGFLALKNFLESVG